MTPAPSAALVPTPQTLGAAELVEGDGKPRAVMVQEQEIAELRGRHYNAEVVERLNVHDELMILRVRPDGKLAHFLPGEYTVLGLGNWEERVPGCEAEHLSEQDLRKVIKRAYSFSSSMLDGAGQPCSPADFPYYEFYVVLVRRGEQHPPGLTPRMFALRPGARLFVGPKATGHYTLSAVRPDDAVVFAATGTGEAPHNAMAAHLLAHGHTGKLVSVTCVRRRADLGYLEQHWRLEQAHPTYRYLTLTTREAENLDASHSNYVGKFYLQEYFDSGRLERDSGIRLDPEHTHVFLCGNPAMIGAPQRDPQGQWQFPSPLGMVEILLARGFRLDERGQSGTVHFEKYW